MKSFKPRISKSRPITLPNGPRQYTCSHCKALFVWGPHCGWFGSLKDMEDEKPLVFACSGSCFEALQALLKYPALPEEIGELTTALMLLVPLGLVLAFSVLCCAQAAPTQDDPKSAASESHASDTCLPPTCWPDVRPPAQPTSPEKQP